MVMMVLLVSGVPVAVARTRTAAPRRAPPPPRQRRGALGAGSRRALLLLHWPAVCWKTRPHWRAMLRQRKRGHECEGRSIGGGSGARIERGAG